MFPMREFHKTGYNSNRAPKVVIVTGAGKKAFSAGIDLTQPVDAVEQSGNTPQQLEKNPVHQMALFPNLIIGAINGHAITGGLELALACDILLASTNAKFTDTHVKYGLQPCWGLAAKLSGMIGTQHARFMSLTASPISAKTGERWGLVSGVSEDAKAAALVLAEKVIGLDCGAIATYKRTLRLCQNAGGLESALQVERERGHRHYVDGAVDQQMVQQVTSAFAKEKPKSKL
eukprot:g33437.t1